MLTGKAKVSSKGWVVIPKEIRDAMKLEPGDEVRLFLGTSDEDGSLRVLKIPDDAIGSTRGKYKGTPNEQAWTEDLLQDRRIDREREERKVARRPSRRRNSA